ncbi:MAG: hypothetical protein LBB89_00745 [Treponema sp.]|jgi:hypothetical protein|nr:hypothetical protein [Treponema sp.]
MKRIILFCMLAMCAIALVSADGNNRRKQDSFRGRPNSPSWNRDSPRGVSPSPESVSVSGNLTIAQGMIAVTSNDITYLARGLNRYTGFIDGLKEGAAVTLEGYALSSPQNDKVKLLYVQKMTLNGKDYDLAWPRQDMPMQQQHRMMQWGRW